ncbi:hypothetical protein ACVWWJ_002669 [Luteibacter sp. HA06]
MSLRHLLAMSLVAVPALVHAQTTQPELVAGSHDRDFSLICTRGHDLLMNIRPDRRDNWRYARDIYRQHLVGGVTEWRFMRGFASADTPDVFVAGADVTCDATPL